MSPGAFIGGPCQDSNRCRYWRRHATGPWTCAYNHPRSVVAPSPPDSPFLTRGWRTTTEIAQAAGVKQRRAGRTLEQLHAGGILDRRARGSWTLWRLASGAK